MKPHSGIRMPKHIMGAAHMSIEAADTYLAPYLSVRYPPSGEVTNTGMAGASITRPTFCEDRL
jgi:hypothetical protein